MASTATVARIQSLDFLRGAAICGMLIANVPWHVGDSMSRVHDPDMTSVAAWLLQYLIVDQRFMPIFAMLFGSGLLLLHSHHKPLRPFAPYYLKRMAVLFGIGVMHAYLLWPGDILITYAVCGPFLLLAVRRTPRELLVLGTVFVGINISFAQWPALYDKSLWAILFGWWVNYGDAPMTIHDAYAGRFTDLIRYNAWRNQFIQWTALPYFRVWNALGFMLIGMGLFKWGVMQGNRSRLFYRKLIIRSLVLGGPLVIYGVLARIGANQTVGPYLGFTSGLPLSNLTFQAGCAVTSLAMLGSLHLLFERAPARIRIGLESIGRMALTNYLMQSALFLCIFHSLKALPFDALDHDVMLAMAMIVWCVQFYLSNTWLSRFGQGPIEALWRRLSGPNPSSSKLQAQRSLN